MARFSVADAKNKLPSLIDRAIEGEEVIITRHGKPVVELRRATVTPLPKGDRRAFHEWFASRRIKPRAPINSVELIREMREADFDRILGRERPDTKPRRRTDQRGG